MFTIIACSSFGLPVAILATEYVVEESPHLGVTIAFRAPKARKWSRVKGAGCAVAEGDKRSALHALAWRETAPGVATHVHPCFAPEWAQIVRDAAGNDAEFLPGEFGGAS